MEKMNLPGFLGGIRSAGCFLYRGEWKYRFGLSDKNPNFVELMENAVLCPEFFDSDSKGWVPVSGAEKIFALVLDGNEGCDARRYWEHICFFAKYDKKLNQLEICDWVSALLEFHELLQGADSLYPDSESDYSGGAAFKRIRARVSGENGVTRDNQVSECILEKE